ncbi:hypothetical protein QUF72_15230 [Desulfobacterales bacterium HSG2]|nr:hypothetical protein [Desulfobacterales bacterium HSG2]
MRTITLEVPDVILESHSQDIEAVKEEVQRGIVIWEYLNGHLTLAECGEILKTGYRGSWNYFGAGEFRLTALTMTSWKNIKTIKDKTGMRNRPMLAQIQRKTFTTDEYHRMIDGFRETPNVNL